RRSAQHPEHMQVYTDFGPITLPQDPVKAAEFIAQLPPDTPLLFNPIFVELSPPLEASGPEEDELPDLIPIPHELFDSDFIPSRTLLLPTQPSPPPFDFPPFPTP